MSAKRKRGSSKKYSKAMETALEQHRDEINEETAKAKENDTTIDNPQSAETESKDNLNSVDDAESTDANTVAAKVDETNDESYDEKADTPETPNDENQVKNDDSTDNESATAVADTVDIGNTHDNDSVTDDTGSVTDSESDDKDDKANDDGQQTASEDDLTDEKNDSDDIDVNEHADTDDEESSDADDSDTTDETDAADTSDADDNAVKSDDTDSHSDSDISVIDDKKDVTNDETVTDAVDTTNNEQDDNADAESDDIANRSTDVNADEKVNNIEINGGNETDAQSDDTSVNSQECVNTSDADADNVTTEESNDSDIDADIENADDVDNLDKKDIAEVKSGGAHFASDDVTDVINDSIEQAQALVDSLTGKSKSNEDNENDSDKNDKETVPDIGVEIKSADEIAESVIGNDDEALKKTIAKLDEMIDEETSKAAATHEQDESAAESTDDSDKPDKEQDEPKEAFTKPVADWFKNTAESIKESVSEKIAEAKEAHEKSKAEKEAKAQEEQAAKEAAQAKDKADEANASLTINEAEQANQNRNDLTAEDASEITGNTTANETDTSTTPDVTQNTVTANAAANETAANESEKSGTETSDKKDGKEQQTSKQPQQPVNPQPYHYPSRRERRRARRAYYGYGTDAAFNRNAYHPDTNRIYAIDPKSYAKMQIPVMPDGTPIDPRRIVVIDASNAPRTLRQGVGLEAADGRYVSKKQGSGAAIAILIVAMLMSGATAAIVTGLVTGTTSSTKSVIQTVAENVNAASKQPAGEAFKNAEESVVSIYSYQATSSYGFDIFGYDPSSDKNDSNTVMSGMGSGVIINGNGDIITNAHIVNGYSDIMVKVGDKEYSAALVGKDDESDLAVIHIEGATDLKPLSFADSSKVGIGDVASTIGAPYGYDKTLSNGVISAINTNGTYETTDGMPMYISLFQTDAVVNAQNAGGALVDSSGNLIGINVQTQGAAGGQGLSFAIPSNYAKKVADQIIANGEAQHGRIGIELRTDDSGAVAIYSVSKNSTASEAGLKAGDVILAVGGNRVKSPSDFMMAIEEQPIGEQVAIKVKRDGTEQTIKVKVEAGTVTQKITVDGKESAKG